VDAHQPEPCAWDAWDGARRDATDAADLRPASSDAGAEKSVDPALDARAQDAWSLQVHLQFHLLVRLARLAVAAELCIPDAVQSAEQSCAALGAAAGQPLQVVRPDASQLEPGAQPMP